MPRNVRPTGPSDDVFQGGCCGYRHARQGLTVHGSGLSEDENTIVPQAAVTKIMMTGDNDAIGIPDVLLDSLVR